MRSIAVVLCTLTMLLVSTAAAPAAQAAGPQLDRGERAVVHAINGARARNGLANLQIGRSLARAADLHTAHMLAGDYFAHGSFAERVRRFVSVRRIGETLAMSSRCSAGHIVRMWLNSPGHRAVLLSPGFHRVGVGSRTGRLGSRRACLVTADFSSRN